MIGPNLSEWALGKRSLVIFLMIVAVVAGTLSFLRLGRGEDPVFTFRTMVVAAAWPGATVEETLLQVTERIERKLQETNHLDTVRSYTTAGQTTIFVDLQQSTPPSAVPDVWYQVRKNIGDIRSTLPTGVVGPFFNDDFGDTYGIIYAFTADGFTFRELRDYVEAARSRLLQVPDVSKIEVLGPQDEQIFIEFSTERLAGLRLDYQTILATLQAQNIIRPAGVIQTGDERVFLRVSGAFDNERDIEAVNFVAGDRIFRLGDIATVRRGFVDPPQPMFRVNGKPAIGLAIAMRDGGDILALGDNIRKAMAEIKANLPVGIEPTLVADQAVTVDVAINDFLASLWQAILIILACSFVSLGMRPGTVVALAIPLTLAIVFSIMDVVQHRSASHLAGRADHRAYVAGRRRDDHGRCDDQPACCGRHEGPSGDLRLFDARGADADRHVCHDRELRAHRIRSKLRGRVHVLDLRGGGHFADRLVAGRGGLRAADRQGDPQGARAESRRQAEQTRECLQRVLERGDPREMANHRLDDRLRSPRRSS